MEVGLNSAINIATNLDGMTPVAMGKYRDFNLKVPRINV